MSAPAVPRAPLIETADVALEKSWSGFAGNRAAEMQDIALVFVLPRKPGRVGSTRCGTWLAGQVESACFTLHSSSCPDMEEWFWCTWQFEPMNKGLSNMRAEQAT